MDSACSVILMGNLPAGATRCELFHHFSGRFSSRHRHSEARRHSRNGKRAGHQETTSGNDLCLFWLFRQAARLAKTEAEVILSTREKQDTGS